MKKKTAYWFTESVNMTSFNSYKVTRKKCLIDCPEKVTLWNFLKTLAKKQIAVILQRLYAEVAQMLGEWKNVCVNAQGHISAERHVFHLFKKHSEVEIKKAILSEAKVIQAPFK